MPCLIRPPAHDMSRFDVIAECHMQSIGTLSDLHLHLHTSETESVGGEYGGVASHNVTTSRYFTRLHSVQLPSC
jgi:hypothetical protein